MVHRAVPVVQRHFVRHTLRHFRRSYRKSQLRQRQSSQAYYVFGVHA